MIAEAQAIVVDTAAVHMWPIPLVCEYLDGHEWRLRFDFRFESPAPDIFPSVTLPAGFTTDFASIPRLAWRYMPPTDHRIGKIGVVHDWYYRNPAIAIQRKHADLALRAGMEALGANRFDRWAVYAAVRVGGGGAFKPRSIAA